MLFAATMTAAVLSILSSVAAARHQWLAFLWLSVFSNIAWLAAETLIMCQIENPLSYAPAVVPTIVAEGAAVAGLVKWLRNSAST